MMTQDQIKIQLDLVNQIVPKLEIYIDRHVSQLPNDVLELIKKTKVGPRVTTSGLESVDNILTGYYLAQIRLKEAYENPDEFKKTYFNQPLSSSNKTHTDTQTLKKQTKISIPITPEHILSHNTDTAQRSSSPITEPKIVIKIKPDVSKQKIQKTQTPPPVSKIDL